jgi:hypothetical protein
MFNLTQGETPMKKTLTRIAGITVLGVAVAAGLAFAQTGGVGPAGPGGRSTDAPNQPAPPTTPEASDRNALPALTQPEPEAPAPNTSTSPRGANPDAGRMDNGSTLSPDEQARPPRSPRADRN